MPPDTLSDFVAATAARFGIPGVAVGMWADGREASGPTASPALSRCWADRTWADSAADSAAAWRGWQAAAR